jgi:hypothetical protein
MRIFSIYIYIHTYIFNYKREKFLFNLNEVFNITTVIIIIKNDNNKANLMKILNNFKICSKFIVY